MPTACPTTSSSFSGATPAVVATASTAEQALLAACWFSLAIVLIYGMHRASLAWRFLRTRRLSQPIEHSAWQPTGSRSDAPSDASATPVGTTAKASGNAPAADGDLPPVTVQIPLFNESPVAARVIDAVCQLDYPRHRLQVQVLDDSTDDCARIASERAATWRARGVDISIIHRDHRTGYKAGALAHALPQAKGQFIAVFDADFVPSRDFLLRMLPPFADPRVGMAQARWTHLNRDESPLTRAQAVLLDGHFLIEHPARHRCGCFFNFNGTAGLWRREVLQSTHTTWEADTLTEDLDISYRAQLAGWKFVYLPHVACPAELPTTFAAFKSQQHRWSTGAVQVARKLLGRVLRSALPWHVKCEAFFHLTYPFASLAVLVLAALLLPMLAVGAARPWLAWLGVAAMLLTLVSTCGYYGLSQRIQGRRWRDVCFDLPLVMMLGVGMSVTSARAVFAALLRKGIPFARTPKRGSTPVRRPRPRELLFAMAEIALGLNAGYAAARVLAEAGAAPGLLLLVLVATGFLWVGVGTLASALHFRRLPAPAAAALEQAAK